MIWVSECYVLKKNAYVDHLTLGFFPFSLHYIDSKYYYIPKP